MYILLLGKSSFFMFSIFFLCKQKGEKKMALCSEMLPIVSNQVTHFTALHETLIHFKRSNREKMVYTQQTIQVQNHIRLKAFLNVVCMEQVQSAYKENVTKTNFFVQ